MERYINDTELVEKVKEIIKAHYDEGTSKNNAITRISVLVTEDEYPFITNDRDMQIAEELYNMFKEEILWKDKEF